MRCMSRPKGRTLRKRLPILAACLWLSLILPLSFAQNDKDAKAPKGDPALGEEVFEAQCVDCHNADSIEPKAGPGLKGVKDGKLPSGKAATRDSILETINQGIGEDMPSFKSILSDKEKEDLVAFVMAL